MTIKKEDLSCPCCGRAIVSPILIEKLNKIEDLYGNSIRIVSGYKCPDFCKNSGLDTDPATRGSTCVISYSNSRELYELLEVIFEVGFRQIKVSRHCITLGLDTALLKYFKIDD